MHSYLIDADEVEFRATQLTFETALEFAVKNDLNAILLVVPNKGNLKQLPLARLFDKTQLRDLSNGYCEVNNIKIRLESSSTLSDIRSLSQPKLVVAYYLDKQGMDKIIARKFDTLIYLPWNLGEKEDFKKTWQPIIVSETGHKADNSSYELDDEVKRKLISLTESVNLSSGIGHPLDKEKAVNLFKSLKKNNIAYDVEAIRAFLITNGWKPRFADNVCKLAQRYKIN